MRDDDHTVVLFIADAVIAVAVVVVAFVAVVAVVVSYDV